ncbi:MAG: helix-turn-helix domain-containing protein [Bacteroidetes bacterium]|nr:helix-turn-helix domain-containing protein [Bacteroidota bacterium]
MSETIKSPNCEFCVYKSYLFESLTREELALVNLNKSERLFHEGDEIKEFLYLKDGLVKLFKEGKSRHEHIISIAKLLDFIGLLSIFSNANYIYSITAIEDSSVCFIDLETIKLIIKRNGKFAQSLLEKMSSISDQVLDTRIELNKKQLRWRIAYILLMFSGQIYNSNKFDLPISRKELGDLIDMRTENVIRILSEFRKDGILKIEGKTFEILDVELLEKIRELG